MPRPGTARGQDQEAAFTPEALLETAIRALTQAFYTQRSPQAPGARDGDARPDLPPLLAPRQAADLLGVSRNTVDRMIQDGELPSIVLREGTRQRMVRVPKGFVLQMIRDLEAGARISMRDYAAQWPASAAAMLAPEVAR